MKGKSARENQCSEKDGYIHALELQVETFALLASRLASLLYPSGYRDQGNMSPVRPSARGRGKAVAEVEMASGTSGRKASTRARSASSKASEDKVSPYRQSEAYREKQREYQRRFYAKRKAAKEAAKKKETAA